MKSGLMQNRMDAVYLIDWSLKYKTAMVVYFQTLSLDGTKKDSFRGEERKGQIKRRPPPKDDLVSGLQNDDIRCFCLFSQIQNQDGNFHKTKCLALPRIPHGLDTLRMLILHAVLKNGDTLVISNGPI